MLTTRRDVLRLLAAGVAGGTLLPRLASAREVPRRARIDKIGLQRSSVFDMTAGEATTPAFEHFDWVLPGFDGPINVELEIDVGLVGVGHEEFVASGFADRLKLEVMIVVTEIEPCLPG